MVGPGLKTSAPPGSTDESQVPSNSWTGSGTYSVQNLSFEEVYSDHFDFVWRSVRGLGIPQAAVDDVVQDVFVIVHRKLADFEARGSLKSWVYGITRRVCKDYRRSATRRGPQLELDPEREVSQAEDPHSLAMQRQALRAVESFANSLDDEHRELMFLALIEGLPTAEVAETLGLNPNTTYSRVRTLRRNLAAHVENLLQSPGASHG